MKWELQLISVCGFIDEDEHSTPETSPHILKNTIASDEDEGIHVRSVDELGNRSSLLLSPDCPASSTSVLRAVDRLSSKA